MWETLVYYILWQIYIKEYIIKWFSEILLVTMTVVQFMCQILVYYILWQIDI
jgi:hypothetical protein